MNLTLLRYSHFEHGTIGMIVGQGLDFALWVAERPWLNNQKNVSCIPTGRWRWFKATHFSGDGVGGKPDYQCIEIEVEGRSLIHAHIGNNPMKDSKGCLLIGEGFRINQHKTEVTNSGVGFKTFMKKLEGFDSGWIEVKNA